jgi:hypothetical protein
VRCVGEILLRKTSNNMFIIWAKIYINSAGFEAMT